VIILHNKNKLKKNVFIIKTLTVPASARPAMTIAPAAIPPPVIAALRILTHWWSAQEVLGSATLALINKGIH
jgi:hypothetical protein